MKEYQETHLKSHADMQPGNFKKLFPIVKEAMLQGVWLYNKYNSRWYTPEEFQQQYENKEMIEFEVRSLMENIIMRDPRGGNTAYHKAIEQRTTQYLNDIAELKHKGEQFLNKVISYYQQKTPRRR
ncbi:MAG: hypothetical protein EOO85_16905 [Pedobacter sp.]|jgi:hypothetical protein|nr:MAG: hypothetical protein EOO85_16905 [Pedobacter sp.]